MKLTAFLLASTGLLAAEPQIDIAQFDQALTEAQTMTSKGQMRPGSFDEIRGAIYRISATISPDPEEKTTRDLLQEACTDLNSRAREAWVAEMDFALMREQVIVMWLDMHMQKLQRMARASGMSRAKYIAYAQQLGEVARSWTPTRPDDQAYRERVRSMIQSYVDRASASEAMEPVAETREQILAERCDRCLVQLERRARAGQGSRYDFTYMAYVILATAEMQLAQNDPRALATIRERLNSVLADLQPAEQGKPWLRVGAEKIDALKQINAQRKQAAEASRAVRASAKKG